MGQLARHCLKQGIELIPLLTGSADSPFKSHILALTFGAEPTEGGEAWGWNYKGITMVEY